MDAQGAEMLLCAITAVGAIIWLVGLQVLVRSFPAIRRDSEIARQFSPEELPPANVLYGTAEVEGRPAELIDKAVAALLKASPAALDPMKIIERRDDRVVFGSVGSDPRGRPWPLQIARAQLRFTPLGPNRTSIDYAAEVAGGQWLLWMGVAFQCLGFAALVGGFCLIRAYVVPDPNPAVRWQTVQMVQAVHFLWPPFLFAAIYRRGRRAVQNGLDLLVHNLPYQAP
jgi:hypothetical protein